MSIHDRHELGLPAFILGLALMLAAGFLASFDRRSEDVRVLSVVVAELKSRDHKRQNLRLTSCKPPIMSRFNGDQKPSMGGLWKTLHPARHVPSQTKTARREPGG
jgi:hypothetical protein